MAKYGKKWQAGTRTIDRYIKEAQEEAEDIQRETSAALRDESIQEAKESFTGRILTKLEKQDKLRQIVDGELECEKIVFIKGEAKKIKAKPDQTDIMKAIDLDNKMAGDYATEKKEVEMDIKWTETKSYDGADEKAD
ncbi:MAG: hypothetical protein V3R57_00875 [Candidatus Bathyarchaeia archaeon]